MFEGEVPVLDGLPGVEGFKLYMRILLPILFFIVIVHVNVLIIWSNEIVEFFFSPSSAFTSHKHPGVPYASHDDPEVIIDDYITILILIREIDIDRRECSLLPQADRPDHVPREHLVLAARDEIRHTVRHECFLRVYIYDFIGFRFDKGDFSRVVVCGFGVLETLTHGAEDFRVGLKARLGFH